MPRPRRQTLRWGSASCARDLPVLTIGDEIDFCLTGGIINLQVIDGRVRFEISLTQARRANLKIESQLLRLATRLHGGQP